MEYEESMIREGQRAYPRKDMSFANWTFLTTEGFIDVIERGLDGERKRYLVFKDKYESPRHMICIQEIIDYLKEFTHRVETYRAVMPDIVFYANGVRFAIEVETGKNIRDKRKMMTKLLSLKKRFGKNWFFFVTNRNLHKAYSKLGKTTTKRGVKFRIRQIFKNS
jgi:hypothetical protein